MAVQAERTSLQRSSTPKREAILQAAVEVFAERGVNGVAVPEIAARAGVGTGTIYRFFESKEALVNELYREQKSDLNKRFSELPSEAEPEVFFKECWDRMVLFVRERPQAFRFLELQDHVSYLDPASRALEVAALEPVIRACRRMQKRGVFRADLRPAVMMALVWGAFVNLFKSERLGYLTLRPKDIAAARDACWRQLSQS
jgi:TetR/AcrR family transcriptional regulator, repressor of fatR-cypB operon